MHYTSNKQINAKMAEWMTGGPLAIADGATGVHITDRLPCYVDDWISPEGGWGWQFGWRWLDDTVECSRWALPEAIFSLLPTCPYAEVRRGIMPRWPTQEEAMLVLNQAAWDWAVKQTLSNEVQNDHSNH